MPLRLPDKLPAIDLLKKENIFVMDATRAHAQDIRPLKIAILNLMPLKITTETDLIRLLSNTPLQLEIDFMKLKSHTPKNTPIEHMMMFYRDFENMKKENYDGMIITGAPVETLQFEDVSYWEEITITIPTIEAKGNWYVVLDTYADDVICEKKLVKSFRRLRFFRICEKAHPLRRQYHMKKLPVCSRQLFPRVVPLRGLYER